jgi:hypothetical protein
MHLDGSGTFRSNRPDWVQSRSVNNLDALQRRFADALEFKFDDETFVAFDLN